jgi:thioredoxin-related protein
MKKLMFLLLLLGGIAQAKAADEIAYVSGSWEQLKARAKAENKYILVDCYTDWCGWCKEMDKKTMTDAGVTTLLNGKFVPAKIEMEHGEGIKLAMKYHVTGFPTFLVFNPAGEFVYESMGYMEAKKFTEEMNNALNPAKQFKSPGYSSSLDVDFPMFYQLAFAENSKRQFPKMEEIISYLDHQKDLLSEVNWGVIARFPLNEKYAQLFFQNIEQYERLYGRAGVNNKVNTILGDQLSAITKSKDHAAFETLLKMVDRYIKEDPASAKVNCRMAFYKETKEWDKYATALDEFAKKNGTENPEYMNSLCWDIYQNIDNKTLVNKACGYMKKVVQHDPKYVYMDTYASLLYKAGKKKEAEQWAGKALAEGKKNGDNTATTEELLKKMKEKK